MTQEKISPLAGTSARVIAANDGDARAVVLATGVKTMNANTIPQLAGFAPIAAPKVVKATEKRDTPRVEVPADVAKFVSWTIGYLATQGAGDHYTITAPSEEAATLLRAQIASYAAARKGTLYPARFPQRVVVKLDDAGKEISRVVNDGHEITKEEVDPATNKVVVIRTGKFVPNIPANLNTGNDVTFRVTTIKHALWNVDTGTVYISHVAAPAEGKQAAENGKK